MRKIRVGFILDISEAWIGGVNYFKNLLKIIDEFREYNIEPVVFVPPNCNMDLLQDFPEIEYRKPNILRRMSYSWIVRKLLEKITGRDMLFEKLLKTLKIDIVSHLTYDLKVKDIYKIAWIPDFQHKYLPHLFSKKEIERRNLDFETLAKKSDKVILSSYDAKRDFIEYFPLYEEKSDVLQFVVPVKQEQYNIAIVKDKYKLNDKFFYIPNQFWQHKNHRIVLQAAKHLNDKNIFIQIVCSGHTEDYRNSGYFQEIKDYIMQNGLEENFKVLGKIPYQEVNALEQHCLALINPSLFEGWSTMVEEAKSIGKLIILSDLAVHKEQNPQFGKFFLKDNPRELADILQNVWSKSDLGNNCFSELVINGTQERKKQEVEQFRSIIDKTLLGRR